MYFSEILDRYRVLSFSQRDKGSRFERLMQGYLLTDPKYAIRFKHVWMWNDFPARSEFGGKDTGIDLVAMTHDGDYWAVQCKCFQETDSIDKPAVDSFLATSSREFHDETGNVVRFAHRLWISTTNKWGSNATETLKNQHPPVTRINLYDLQEAPVDWEKLEQGIHGEPSRITPKTLYPHQREAMDKAHEYFKTNDRGKLIMACGTGKTFTSLRIAERETGGDGLILFLVPSIALLGQTLREWSASAMEPMNAICICSDPEVSKKKTKHNDSDAFSTIDLALPASTDPDNILRQFEHIRKRGKSGLTVVFSTYQSIDVIAKAQDTLLRHGFTQFDLIICDEAHRTTGVTLSDKDESAFTKVHDGTFIKAKKRMYMTATPRLYSDDAKSRAAEADAVLCSMDDPAMYGEEIYRIGFGEAVERDLLTDYKVLILTLNDRDVPPAVQKMIAGMRSEISTDDASKLIGCINALSKQFHGDDGVTRQTDPEPMRRAVAFCQSIAISKEITAIFNVATHEYLGCLPEKKKTQMVTVSSTHIDGTMSAPVRDEMLSWLKAPSSDNECRILTNVRVLSEGVDVPSLDAVMFLSARNSQVDVVQSVGRVMRRAKGKKYGYIIIPVVIPADVDPNKALDDNERYKVVWTVLNALRAHDDRFNATVNKIELNKKRTQKINVGTPDTSFDEEGNPIERGGDSSTDEIDRKVAQQLAIQFEELQSVVFARMVKKVGDRRYWEQWAKDVAIIAERQIERIQYLVQEKRDQRKAFDAFLEGLRKNINPSISEEQAIEMLAQHIITKPIFEALFEGYSFEKNNAVSIAMQAMLNALEQDTFEQESAALQKFYESVRKRAEGIDNAQGKQRIIIELYDKFFKTAFPTMVEQLGIVYTPVEIVDFILHSVDDVLKQEFGRSLSDENIHILDPFTGTGTFITRLLQSGLIEDKDLRRKYREELYANEIVLLAYYIAAVNIENAYHDHRGELAEYESFEGIALTDTFQLGETDDRNKIFSEMFPQNSERVERQKKAPLRVIIGNPPYSVGQKSANDNAQNMKYEKLDSRIARTYARVSTATNKNSLYDTYIKAFRWSTDRLDPKNGGIIAFVSNGAWLDGNSADGFRKVIEREFSSIWVFNTRGNARTQGELRRKEAGNVFGGGSRTPIAITLLVKNPEKKTERATIHYHDIGDYLSREEKLAIVGKHASVSNPEMAWELVKPNEQGDWIDQRNEKYEKYLVISPEKKFDLKSESFFVVNSRGNETSRDAWSYSSSRRLILSNMKSSIEFYNGEVRRFIKSKAVDSELKAKDFVNFDSTKISWSSSLLSTIESGKEIVLEAGRIEPSLYRPFFKQVLYRGEKMIHRRGQFDAFFPDPSVENRVICVSGLGGTKENSAIITDCIPDLNCLDAGTQCFPLYYYEDYAQAQTDLFSGATPSRYARKDGITDFILNKAQTQYGGDISKQDIFYYVYGFLHSPEYREAFANDLKKMLPRIPLVEKTDDFWHFSRTGRQLADLHINYEQAPPFAGVQVTGVVSGFFRVEKMRFPRKGQRDTILFNSRITVSGIPAQAYDYVVNGKSAIEWIMERYQITVHKDSGIKNDPNDWAEEVGNPRYILDLLLSIINVSMQTVEIVKGLPKLSFL
jgi:predicted helicase